jgi:hypothetical protein
VSRETENPPLCRTVHTPQHPTVTLTLSPCGLILWLDMDVDAEQWVFPVPALAWGGIRTAAAELLAEAHRRAQIATALQELLDPITGPEGEA